MRHDKQRPAKTGLDRVELRIYSRIFGLTMFSAKPFLLPVFCLAATAAFSQHYFAYGSSNYGGVAQVIANPASAAGSLLKVDVLVAGFEADFNNSWVGVKKEALSFPKLPESWKNHTPNVPDNIYKNFEWQRGSHQKEVVFEQRLLLPSVLVRLNARNSLAFTCSMRQIGNISGISPALAHLFENEFDLSVLQNNPVQNKNFSALRMSWMEYGLTYARTVYDKGNHRLKAGITPKLVQGLESSYFLLRDLNFLFSNKDTLSYLEADFSTAHSTRTGPALNIAGNPMEKLSHAAALRAGLDLGLIYEWHRSGEDAGEAEKKPGHVARADYKLKAGISLVDLGSIRFKKEPNYYDLAFSLRQTDIIRYLSSENVKMIDSLLHHDFPANTGDPEFRVFLPTAFNTQLDYAVSKKLFVNLSSHVTGFNSTQPLRVKNYTALCIAPRYESYWIDAALLLSWSSLSAKQSKRVVPGVHVRLGPLVIGSSDLTFLTRNSVASLNFYTQLRVSIPYKTRS